VLDVGCGAGAWTEILAARCGFVIGFEQSASMVRSAKARRVDERRVEIRQADVREDLPEGPFDLIFVGGLCMYLNDVDLILWLRSLQGRLALSGSVVLRESTVPTGRTSAKGGDWAVYRSVDTYRRLFQRAGFSAPEVRRNHAYTAMEVAIELVELRRRRLTFLPTDSSVLGALTWWSLRCAGPNSFRFLPRFVSKFGSTWPRSQNHFFRLRG